MKTITIPELGISVVTRAPSPGFDPSTASSAQLVANGFPAMPDDPAHQAHYRAMLARLKGRYQYIEPQFKVHPEVGRGIPRLPSATGNPETSSVWSGGVVFAPVGKSFKWIQGYFVIPNSSALDNLDNIYTYIAWVGIDGDNSSDVFQAGALNYVQNDGPNNPIRQLYAWWEWFPNVIVEISNFNINTGDLLAIILCSSQGLGSTTGTVYMTNITTGHSTNVAMSAPGGTTLVGNSAEWIVEAPHLGGSPSTLADYGQCFFSQCYAVTADGQTINGGTGDSIAMDQGLGAGVVSQGILVSPTVVQCQYVGTLGLLP
jgi:hypothetical protein